MFFQVFHGWGTKVAAFTRAAEHSMLRRKWIFLVLRLKKRFQASS